MEDMHVQTFISGGGVQNILFKGGPPNFLAKKIFLEQKHVAKTKIHARVKALRAKILLELD